MSAAQVEIVYRNLKGEELSVFLEPTEIPLAKRWIAELKRVLQGPHFLEKDQAFCGFLDSPRDFSYLSGQINHVIEVIEQHRAPGLWESGYSIPERCSPETITPELMNRLHHHFEILRGQTWNTSPYLMGLERRVADAIRRLNVLVHEIEAQNQSILMRQKEGRIFPFSVVHFLYPEMNRPPQLAEEDYEYFSTEEGFGFVQMHYCQIGKTHYQAWHDGDTDIFDDNVNNLRFYSSGFLLDWGDHSQGIRSINLFLDWLRKSKVDLRGSYFIDKNGVKQGIGFLNIAKAPLKQFGSRSIPEIQALLAKYSDIHRILVHENGSVVESRFEYRVDDADYFSRLIAHYPD
jgi:hypothetical protein